MIIHRAKKEEDLYDIAQDHGVAPHILREAVGSDGVRKFNEGRELIIPKPTRTYGVRVGDTLKGIADRFGVRCDTLKALNPELCGEDKIYPGQILTVKTDTPTAGVAVTNGYCYRGCTIARLKRYLPYANFVTLQAARAIGKEIKLEEWDNEAVELCNASGKTPLIRIYIENMPSKDEYGDLMRASVLAAKSRGYHGITLANLSGDADTLKELVMCARRATLENGLILVTEGAIGKDVGYTEYSDHAVLTYDKLHLDKIPSFEDGERRSLSKHADKYEVLGSFVELPAFALTDKGYISREDAFSICDRSGTVITHDDERRIMKIQHRGDSLTAESVENTKAKLELVGELGYLGVSFDILRVPIFELLLMRSLLREAGGIGGAVRLNCRGDASYSSGGM